MPTTRHAMQCYIPSRNPHNPLASHGLSGSPMKAIAVSDSGDAYRLSLVTRTIPNPGPGEILIKVAAAGINRPDILQCRGAYPPPSGVTDVPGLEVAGTVIALGRDVREFALGDPVTALLSGGGYAEYCVAAASLSFKIPQGLTLQEAAGLPEALFTVWANVFEAGGLQPGETLLVQGGGSGIGTIAIQMGRLFGARVLATAGSDEKCRACTELGAETINYRTDNFRTRIKEITDGAGVDVILDMVGGPYLADHLALLAPGGRLSIIAVQGGYKAAINLLPILSKHLLITGSTLRPRSLAEKSRLAAAIRQHVWPWIDSGQLRPIIDSRFPLAQALLAHQRMLSGKHIGKIILSVESTE